MKAAISVDISIVDTGAARVIYFQNSAVSEMPHYLVIFLKHQKKPNSSPPFHQALRKVSLSYYPSTSVPRFHSAHTLGRPQRWRLGSCPGSVSTCNLLTMHFRVSQGARVPGWTSTPGACLPEPTMKLSPCILPGPGLCDPRDLQENISGVPSLTNLQIPLC